MKIKELVKGNWYKSKFNNYFKFLEMRNNKFYSSEEIYNTIWDREDGKGCCGGVWINNLTSINLSEIQEYLPENHPDKLNKNNNQYLIKEAKRMYPIGTKIYQLYSGGTSNYSSEITIKDPDNFTIDSDNEVLYLSQWRICTSNGKIWAKKIEEKEFELPELWYVEINKDTYSKINEWWEINTASTLTTTGICGIYKSYINKICKGQSSNINSPTFINKITFEQFKKYVLKENDNPGINNENFKLEVKKEYFNYPLTPNECINKPKLLYIKSINQPIFEKNITNNKIKLNIIKTKLIKNGNN